MNLIIVLIIIVGSVVLHELSHGIVAYWLGDPTAKNAGRLSFNPIKHIDPYMSIIVPVVLYLLNAPVFGGAKPVPVNYANLKWREWGMALTALAGPLMNFLLAFLAFLIGHLTGWLYGSNELLSFIFARLISINLGFMIFNLIPIPPLDGSRILYAIAPDGFRSILTALERYGLIMVYMFIFLFSGILSSIMLNGMQSVLNLFYWVVGVR